MSAPNPLRTIALDAMGGDHAPEAPLRAAAALSRSTDIRLLLVGDPAQLEPGRFAYEALDRVLHERARLGIMTSLVTQPEGVSFGDLKQLCGLTDGSVAGAWRLPNRNELFSLLYGGSGLPLDHPFIKPAENGGFHWSSTTYPNGPQFAWTIRIFEDGYQDRAQKADANLVIAVRGGF